MKTKEQVLKANEDKRTKCTVYTRVMGYHRPVESFNIGKKGEHAQRCYFEKTGS
ncbi:MAG: anaerobic ribonucleoside-triphosphate reductase [Campylobacterota bacterium]